MPARSRRLDTPELERDLLDARARALRVTGGLQGERLLGPKLAIVNPPLWEIGHVSWFQERWCLRLRADGSLGESILPGADALYDSSAVAHDTRWDLMLPSRQETLRYLRQVQERIHETVLQRGPSADEVYFLLLSIFHEDMHGEAFAYTRQTLGYAPPRFADGAPFTGQGGPLPGDVEIAGGTFQLGAGFSSVDKLVVSGSVSQGNIFGSGYDEATLTEAADAYQPGQVLVAEISSFQLEWVSQWHPRVATVTNVTDDHLNRHATFEEYRAAKHRIFTNMGAGDIAVAHSGDPMVVPPAGVPVEWFGNDGDPSFVADAQWTLLGSTVAVSQLSTPEPHNLLNAQTAALMAVRVSEMVGRPIAPSEAQAALTSFRPLAHRMEVVGERKGVLLVNNSMCTNPAAVVASSQGMARRQHLLVGGAAKTSDFSPLAEYLREQPHQVYLFGQDAPLIRERLQGGWPVYSDIAEAFRAAVDAARSGEAVILSPGCASFDRFEGFWARGDLFKTLAKEWLER